MPKLSFGIFERISHYITPNVRTRPENNIPNINFVAENSSLQITLTVNLCYDRNEDSKC